MKTQRKQKIIYKTTLRQALQCFLLSGIFTIIAPPAHAQVVVGGAMRYALCTILSIVQGPLGDGAATIGVMSVGIGAVMGKVSMGMAITVAVGISILFSAANLAGIILGVDPAGICP